MKDMKGQLTFRGVLIGCLGCVVITAASIYTALRMGALPWPIVFAAIISLFFLKAVSKNTSTLNEANVTHTVMSAGAMVAGGLAFTIPGAWMLGLADQISLVHTTVIALCGVALGLICTALLRRHFIEDAQLEFPIGEAAAQTLVAGERGGSTGKKLFGAMGFAGMFAFLRDGVAAIPAMVANLAIPGVSFGIYVSPMMLSIGFLVGTGAVCVWFAGAVLGNFGIIVGAPALGICDTATAQGVVSSLGMGVMMGSGFAVIAKDILPKAYNLIKKNSATRPSSALGLTAIPVALDNDASSSASKKDKLLKNGGIMALSVAAIALLLSIFLNLSPVVSVVVVLLSFVTCAMSAQSVGQTGIDPMEIFGLIVLLIVAAFADVAQVQLFFIAAIVAVACGLAGDVMNDFKAGHVLGTNPQAQIIGQAIGGVVGALVSVVVMFVLLSAYGAEAFGPQGTFVAAQASVVATMISGIPHVGAFIVGLIAGFALYLVKFPSMMLGLGIYLPFYMSFTAFLGAMCKVVYDIVCKRRLNDAKGLTEEERAQKLAAGDETGLVIASGLLGGESIVGIILAMAVAFSGIIA